LARRSHFVNAQAYAGETQSEYRMRYAPNSGDMDQQQLRIAQAIQRNDDSLALILRQVKGDCPSQRIGGVAIISTTSSV